MRIGSGGLGEPLARPTPSLQDTPLKPGCQLLTQLKPKKANLRKHLLPPRLRGRTPKARERVRILRSWTKPVGSSGLLGFALSCSFPLQGLCRLTGTPFCVSPEGRAASPCTHPSKKKKKVVQPQTLSSRLKWGMNSHSNRPAHPPGLQGCGARRAPGQPPRSQVRTQRAAWARRSRRSPRQTLPFCACFHRNDNTRWFRPKKANKPIPVSLHLFSGKETPTGLGFYVEKSDPTPPPPILTFPGSQAHFGYTQPVSAPSELTSPDGEGL